MKLIVADETATCFAIGRVFEQHGHSVELCVDGRGALASVAWRDPDLLLLSLQLPDLDAAEIVRRMRDAHLMVPVLLLDGRVDREVAMEALAVGADAVFAKAEFDARSLVAHAETLVRWPQWPKASSCIAAGGFVIDSSAQTAALNGSALHVTRMEFVLLGVLVRSMGRTVRRESLQLALRAAGGESSEQALGLHLDRLGQKLGADGFRVKAVPSQGYVLAPQPRELRDSPREALGSGATADARGAFRLR